VRHRHRLCACYHDDCLAAVTFTVYGVSMCTVIVQHFVGELGVCKAF
jgi:hypothetical protein